MGFVGAVFCSAYRTRIINFRTHNRLNNELTILLLLGRLVARTLNAHADCGLKPYFAVLYMLRTLPTTVTSKLYL